MLWSDAPRAMQRLPDNRPYTPACAAATPTWMDVPGMWARECTNNRDMPMPRLAEDGCHMLTPNDLGNRLAATGR